jgi:hypothetical protein
MKTLILAAIRCSLMFAAVTASLFSVQPVQAYTVTLEQMGADVVANGSGAINLTGLVFFGSGSFFITTLVPSLGRISTGPPPSGIGSVDLYRVFSGPANFGSGSQHNATESLSSGNFVGIQASVNELFVPHGYISNSALRAARPGPVRPSPASAWRPAPTYGRGGLDYRTRTSRS